MFARKHETAVRLRRGIRNPSQSMNIFLNIQIFSAPEWQNVSKSKSSPRNIFAKHQALEGHKAEPKKRVRHQPFLRLRWDLEIELANAAGGAAVCMTSFFFHNFDNEGFVQHQMLQLGKLQMHTKGVQRQALARSPEAGKMPPKLIFLIITTDIFDNQNCFL